MLEVGTRVSGKYFGHDFSGVVRERRPHTMNAAIIYFVDLDQPMSVFGDVRSSLSVTTGSPETSIGRT